MIALPSPPKVAILIGTMAVLGALTTTCVRLEFDRRRFEGTLDLERRKFEHEQARLLFDREKLNARKTTLTDSARKRAEHELLRISSKKVGSVDRAFTHIDATAFIQNVFDEFVAIGFIED